MYRLVNSNKQLEVYQKYFKDTTVFPHWPDDDEEFAQSAGLVRKIYGSIGGTENFHMTGSLHHYRGKDFHGYKVVLEWPSNYLEIGKLNEKGNFARYIVYWDDISDLEMLDGKLKENPEETLEELWKLKLG